MRQSDLERAVQAEKEKGELEQQLSNAQRCAILCMPSSIHCPIFY